MSQDQPVAPELEGVVPASALVAYQPGTVVSRTLVRKPAGTVTVFAFDAGEGLSEHTAPFDALALDLEGEADIFDCRRGPPSRRGPAAQAPRRTAARGEGDLPLQDAPHHDQGMIFLPRTRPPASRHR
jgi:hypothetical protein